MVCKYYRDFKVYYIKWKLKDENGLVWEEEYKEMSLDDFEELYGMNVHEIIEVELKLYAEDFPCDHDQCKP